MKLIQRITLLLGVVSVLALGSEIRGQNALGSGDALDANLSTRGRHNAPSTRIDFRSRNLLVTGNVAGGRGFRGSVGYVAANDFRGTVGSDVSYRFRADSAMSSPSVLRMGGLTYQRARFGQNLGALEFRRDTTAVSRRSLTPGAMGASDLLDHRVQLDRATQSRAARRMLAEREEPDLLGYTVDEADQPWYIQASSLRGISLLPISSDGREVGLSSYDQMRLAQDRAAGRDITRLGEPFQTDFQRLGDVNMQVRQSGTETGLDHQVGDAQMHAAESDYLTILRRVADRMARQRGEQFEVEPQAMQRMNQQYAAVRGQLSNQRTRAATTGSESDPEADPLMDPAPAGAAARRSGEPEVDVSVDDLANILRHGQRVTSLSEAEQNRFNELVKLGEQRLREGEYYRAETRFVHALRFIPGHPLATAGLGHAQLGAGNYLSASLTLRSLLVHQPEMLDTRYDQGLMPNHVRLGQAIDRLRQLLNRGVDANLYAFLLAYIGHQLEDEAMVREGLEALERANADDQLLPLLQHVWLGAEEDEAGEPPVK